MGRRKIKRKKTGPSGLQKGAAGMIQQLQEDMLEAQEEIAETTVTATAGGGAVTAVVTGEHRVQSITIEPEVIDPEDVEMLQDLVAAAVNEALKKAQEMVAEEMAKVTGGMSIPGLM